MNLICVYRNLLITMVALASFTAKSPGGKAELVDSTLRPELMPRVGLTFARFMSAVAASNIDLAVQRYNVSISQAQLAAARVSPNPTLNIGATRELTDKEQSQNESVGLTQLIEVGGKRRFRVSVATRNLLAASATLDDFFRALRGTAANAFIDSVASEMILRQKRKAFEALNKLTDLNRIRLQEGDIADVDYNQVLVNSLQARGDVTATQVTVSTNLLVLLQLLGKPAAPILRPSSELKFSQHDFDLTTLLRGAMETRPDILAARSAHMSTLSALRLARANRLPDLTLSAAVQQNESGRNPINPSPNFNALNFGISVPLPIFNSYRGEYLAAERATLQSKKALQAIELKAEIEVRQNFERFRLAKQRAAQYEGPILDLAAKVLEARLLAYKAGGATLLDVLNAQKADTDVRLASIDALSEQAKALIALEQAAGIWDVDF